MNPPPPADPNAPPAPSPIALDDPSLYLNRELSWLEFNRRVLDEARDPAVPLLERVKFLAIFGSNLDEFFMVRVGGLQQKVLSGIARGSLGDKMSAGGCNLEEHPRARLRELGGGEQYRLLAR